MCHNHITTATEFENMLAHELIHAFDHCRAADLDWGNCRHHACSEVRGDSLSLCVCSVTASVVLTCDSSCVGARRQSEWRLQLHARAAAGQLGDYGAASEVCASPRGAERGDEPGLSRTWGCKGSSRCLLRRLLSRHSAIRPHTMIHHAWLFAAHNGVPVLRYPILLALSTASSG
jgi:hypothetical protein